MTILPVAVTRSELPATAGLTIFLVFMLLMPLRIVGGPRTRSELRCATPRPARSFNPGSSARSSRSL